VKFHKLFLSAAIVGLPLLQSAAKAQSTADVAFGTSTTSVPSTGTSINTFGDGTLYSTPSMHGAFGKVSGNVMFNSWFGLGGDYTWRYSQGDYAGLGYRPSFYDVNAVFKPSVGSRRIEPEFQAGLGGMRLGFYQNRTYCNSFTGCSGSSNLVGSSNHFQVHGLTGVRFYVTRSVFVRPEVEVHWVNNLFQFGSNWVPQYGVSLGYSFGRGRS